MFFFAGIVCVCTGKFLLGSICIAFGAVFVAIATIKRLGRPSLPR